LGHCAGCAWLELYGYRTICGALFAVAFGLRKSKSAEGYTDNDYQKPYAVWERLQMTLYFVQELTISGFYVYEIVRMLKPHMFDKFARKQSGRSGNKNLFGDGKEWKSEAGKKVLNHLLWINCFIVALDISMMVTEYIGQFEVQVVYKAFVYSVKLKMEFKILNQLTDIAQNYVRSIQPCFSGSGDGSTWVSPGGTTVRGDSEILGSMSLTPTVSPTSPRNGKIDYEVDEEVEKEYEKEINETVSNPSPVARTCAEEIRRPCTARMLNSLGKPRGSITEEDVEAIGELKY